MKIPATTLPLTAGGLSSAPGGYICSAASERFVGLDLGAETVKAVELVRENGELRWARRAIVEHRKQVRPAVAAVLQDWQWEEVDGAAATGRLGRQLALNHVPTKQAQCAGARLLLGERPMTIVSIGSHGFSILEMREPGLEIFRENSRCSQGTGNFLRQLVGRFALTIEEASALCREVKSPAVLSGRCPVILKTDMTHLANKGENRAAILAGLFDAVCENVLVLIKPELCPRDVVLTGGVSRSPRIRATFQARLAESGLRLESASPEDTLFLEALGCAVLAATGGHRVPPLAQLMPSAPPAALETVPALRDWRSKVHRMTASVAGHPSAGTSLVLGFDIGSTGSKVVALTAESGRPVWEGYRATGGDPVGAAQALVQEFRTSAVAALPIQAFGVTGSGREIVGSLLTVCYGADRVYVLNEIAAHAAGAHHHDARVDTIFEIGGQDAKYIRLADGRVVDCAMNEACSAGTGSFIEEQGRRFSGITGVRDLAAEAMAADAGVSLGQHCSVFMAEVIDQAVASGAPRPSIIAGLYDSIIQNYLNRVKGSRPVGKVIFCQGMPFASDALAAAVARQTGAEVIVPPNPGTVGALGIALLARREFSAEGQAPVDLSRFLAARVAGKDTFACKSVVGCGGAGNRCRIERLRTEVAGRSLNFTWGGACALHDRGTRKRKLPDRAPDPFREREALRQQVLAPRLAARGGRRIALTDEFALKGLLPFFATYLHELGFDLVFVGDGNHADVKHGIRGANVPFCAPMQIYHGVAARLANSGVDYVFLPMLRSLPPVQQESHAVACPIVQASPDLLRWDLGALERVQMLSPVINFGAGGLDSREFLRSCAQLAASVGVTADAWRAAHARAREVQVGFDRELLAIGRRALAFAAEHDVTPVVVLGRPYTIHNPVLNSNVPAILREQGAIGIPVDCYPVSDGNPVYEPMYWGHGQRILRAAHQIRRAAGHYSLYCSNYACGPDSFNLHFYAHIMAGKPFAIIETDGHSGDAGTKTRVEAFLHCVSQDRASADGRVELISDFGRLRTGNVQLREIIARREHVLIPWMGDGSQAVAAALRGRGVRADSLPPPGPEALRIGRRHTSGKECLPMALTLGGLLERLGQARPGDRFVYLMSSTHGPCRFGVYNLLNQIVLEQLGWGDRIRIWSPPDNGYFAEFPPSFGMVTYAGLVAADTLNEMATTIAAAERSAGAAQTLLHQKLPALLTLIEQRAAADIPTTSALWQVVSGELFGIRDLLADTAREFAGIRDGCPRPTVMMVGEIYVRCVPFANGFTAQELRKRGIAVRLAPVHEWLEYCGVMAARARPRWQMGPALSDAIQDRIRHVVTGTIDAVLGWPRRHATSELLDAARPYVRDALGGEAVLTIGGPLCAWREHQIDGVISVGPHECMPNKISESQFFHIAEDEGLPSLTLGLNGDPVDPELVDNFAFEVKARFAERRRAEAALVRA